MHNIDRTTLESGYGDYEYDETEYEFEGEDEYYEGEGEYFEDEGEYYEGEGEYYEDEGEYFEGEGEYGDESEYYEMYSDSPFSEAEEMELAADLLNVTNEQELDQFIGKLFRKARKRIGRRFRKFRKSRIGRRLGGIVKRVAKKALPALGGAVGNVFAPGIGGVVGSKLASSAGSMFGLELEGLSEEDQEFEIARQVVRFGGATAKNAAKVASKVPPQKIAQVAAATAAKQFAPGLLNSKLSGRSKCRCKHKKTGRWIRRGRNIVILGA